MKYLSAMLCLILSLICLTSCSILNPELSKTESWEFCCCETCCEGFEVWDESWERPDDEIHKIKTKTGYHIVVTRSYHN